MYDTQIFLSFQNMKQIDQRKLLQEWDRCYYEEDSPLVNDATYDQCVSYYNEKYEKKYTSSLGNTSDAFKKYNHSYPVLSLNKINTKEAYEETTKKYDYNVLIQPKIDGLTVVYYPDGKLVSRGNGHEGEILPFASKIPNLPKPLNDAPVRMEVFISKENFAQHFSDSNKNSRNVAAGILRRKEYTKDIEYLSYRAYNVLGLDDKSELEQIMILKFNKFNTVEFLLINNKETAENAYRGLQDYASNQEYDTDGIVIKYNKAGALKELGATSHHPNNMVAYKFQSLVKETVLKDIRWSPGRNKLTPVAIFDPVVLGGSTVTQASVHNLNIINKLKLKIGAKIMVTLKNEIIPQIIECFNEDTSDIIVPQKCPYCSSSLIINSTQELVCTNPSCSMLHLDSMEKIASKQGLDIKGLSNATIEKLYNVLKKKGSFSAFQFLNVTVNELKESGLTDYMAVKIYNTIQASKKNVQVHHFLYACNIPGLGYNTAKTIMKKYNNDIDRFITDFSKNGRDIEGVGEILYSSIVNNIDILQGNMKFIDSFKEPEIIKYPDVTLLKVAISGTLSHPRNYYQDLLESKGHTFSSSVTKDTDYLVAGESTGSKIEKAKKYGVKIITESELLELIK